MLNVDVPPPLAPNPNVKKVIKYIILAAIVLAVFCGGFVVGKQTAVCNVCKPETVDFSLFWDAYTKLKGHFINPDDITDQKIMYGAIEGMTKSLGDPYTSFFDPEQAKAFEQELSGSFEGIGVEVAMKEGQLTVVSPLKNTPGEKAGLKAGDQIIRINNESTADITTEEAVNLIRGKGGTSVTLTIFREGWDQTKDISIIRATIKIPSMEWELKDGDVAYIRLYQFNQALSGDFKKAASEILSSSAKKIVLDMRNNPGGYLEICQEIAGWFMERGQIVTIEDFGKAKGQEQYLTKGNASLAEFPIVVLVNNGSASASEILAGALHDNRNVKLIGEKTFGKGSVQEVVDLQDGDSFLKITIAKWLTPKGVSISDVGLNPDITVEAGEDTAQDPQLAKALEIIKDLH